MAYSDYETSRDRGQPVRLYQFVYGVQSDGTTPIYLAYTDGESEVVHDSVTYTPLPVRATEIKSSGKMETNELRLVVPRNSEVADLFRVYPPSRVVTITIREGHIPNGDDPAGWDTGENFPVVWLGRILESSREGPEATLTCEAASKSLKRSGLRRHYQWPCPLVLYGTRCQADKAAATTTTTVAAITGNRVTLNAPWQKQVPIPETDPVEYQDIGANAYTGGLLEWTGMDGPEYRTIMRVSGTNEIVLNAPAFDLDVADEVDVILGCPHTLKGCGELHDNLVNYGGHPFIPTENPVGKNNHT